MVPKNGPEDGVNWLFLRSLGHASCTIQWWQERQDGEIWDCARCSRAGARAGARRKRDDRLVRSTQHMGVAQRRSLKVLSEHADSKKKGDSSCVAMEDRTKARAEQFEANRINGQKCRGFAEADTICERATGNVFQKAEAFVKRRSSWIWQRTSSTGCSSICTRGPKTA